jgi:hypothetical protein
MDSFEEFHSDDGLFIFLVNPPHRQSLEDLIDRLSELHVEGQTVGVNISNVEYIPINVNK